MIPLLRRGWSETEAKAASTTALERIGLGPLLRRRPAELSGGQQQRVSIARAVAGQPALLLADEPTGNLDSKDAEIVMSLFEELNRDLHMTLVMITHDPSFAKRASRQVQLKDGTIVSDERQV